MILIWDAVHFWQADWHSKDILFRAVTMEPEESEDIEIFENWLEGTVEIIRGVPVVCVDGLIQMKEIGQGKRFSGYCINEKVRKPVSFIRFKFIGRGENIIAKQGRISVYYALLVLAQNDKWQKEQSLWHHG